MILDGDQEIVKIRSEEVVMRMIYIVEELFFIIFDWTVQHGEES